MPNGQNPPNTGSILEQKKGAFLRAFFSLPTLLSVVLIASFIFIFYMVRNTNEGVSNVDFARGLITLLFAVGTIAIALILTFTAVFQNDPGSKERFERGKEILSVLIGIFGTIIGFYFGSSAPKPTTNVAKPIIASINPNTITLNAEVKLLIDGENFSRDSVVQIDNKAVDTTFISSNRLEAQVMKDITSSAAEKSVKVVTSGVTSNSKNIKIAQPTQ
jgi:IPT/TIG domain-containing protein